MATKKTTSKTKKSSGAVKKATENKKSESNASSSKNVTAKSTNQSSKSSQSTVKRAKSVAKSSSAKRSSKASSKLVSRTTKNVRKAPSKPRRSAKSTVRNARVVTFNGLEFLETNKSMEAVMTQSKVKFDKITQDATNTSRENIDVIMKSGNIFFKGYEGVVQTWVTIAQKSAEQNSQAVKTLMGCKTLNELTEAQNRIAQQNFDEWVNGTSKLSEQCVKVLTDALEPINDQLGKAIKKASEAVSA